MTKSEILEKLIQTYKSITGTTLTPETSLEDLSWASKGNLTATIRGVASIEIPYEDWNEKLVGTLEDLAERLAEPENEPEKTE